MQKEKISALYPIDINDDGTNKTPEPVFYYPTEYSNFSSIMKFNFIIFNIDINKHYRIESRLYDLNDNEIVESSISLDDDPQIPATDMYKGMWSKSYKYRSPLITITEHASSFRFTVDLFQDITTTVNHIEETKSEKLDSASTYIAFNKVISNE